MPGLQDRPHDSNRDRPGSGTPDSAAAASGLVMKSQLREADCPVADSRDGSPNGFHVLSVDGQNYSTRFQPANEPNLRQMRIVLDSEFHRDRKELYAEFRMGQLLGSPIPQETAFATSLIVN